MVTVTGWGGSSKLCLFVTGAAYQKIQIRLEFADPRKETDTVPVATSQRETSEVVTIEVRNRRERFTGSKWCSQVYWDILLSEDLWHWQFWNKMKALHQNYDFTWGFSICLMVKIINLTISPIKSLNKKISGDHPPNLRCPTPPPTTPGNQALWITRITRIPSFPG